jgi:serine/threonine protein kinase
MTETTTHRNALPISYQLQEYIIRSVLGDGGFGITYLAKDTQLNALVAIKEYLPNDLAVRENDYTVQAKTRQGVDFFTWGLERFLQEARILAQFKHPSIVRVLRYFQAHNTAYFVMEYERGRSLIDAVHKGDIANEVEMKKLLLPLLDALEMVHNAGYLHRDIKPDNIYLREDNSPVLLDFGAARFEINQRSRSVTSIVTPGYAPFEQYESDGAGQGAWTDIYALGAVLYHIIWGIKPVAATKRISAVMRGTPDPMKPAVEVGRGKYSTNFLQAIDFALKVKQEDRPKNVKIWRTQLFPNSQTDSQTDLPSPDEKKATKGGSHLKWYYGVAILLLLLVASGGYWLLDYVIKEPEQPDRLPRLIQSTASLETASGSKNPDSLSLEEQIATERRRLNAARIAAARESERLEQNLAQVKQEREDLIQRKYIQLAKRDAIEIGQKIWMNESSGKISGLTTWNEQELFASLGIGHFIWYPQGRDKSFTETFPDLLKFMQKQGVILSDWLKNTPNCPWGTRQEFMNSQQSDKMNDLRMLMKSTVPLQVQFMIKRLEFALPKMMDTLPTQEQQRHVREQFYRMAQSSPTGVFALLDYVHFKGEGTSPTERYQNQGWGLLQVLEKMSGDSTNDAINEFIEAAKAILKRRIQNSPPERHEVRWWRGWKNRLDTY